MATKLGWFDILLLCVVGGMDAIANAISPSRIA